MKTPSILMVLPYGFNDRLANFPEFTVSRLLARSGWQVTGLTRRESGERRSEDVQGIRVHKYGGTIEGVFVAFRLLIMSRPDVVHVHTLRNNRVGIVSAMLAKLLRIPLAFTEAGLLHDHYLTDDRDDPLDKPIHFERVARNPIHGLRSYFFHWPLTHADRVVFFSKHNVLIAEKLGLADVRYIPIIIDDARWKSREAGGDIAAKLPEGPYGLFVGQMKLRKGWDVLLRAIPFVREDALAKFVFVSSSPRVGTNDLFDLAGTLGIKDRIVYLGKVPSNADMRTVFEKSAVVIVPSRYEGFGLVPLEAFETGKPVVASRVEALTDYLVHGENAHLVEPENPQALASGIQAVVSDKALARMLAAGGDKTLERMKSGESAQEWLTFYREMLRA